MFVVNMQCATMKYEMIRKPMVQERVYINSLEFARYYKKNLEMIPFYLINSKEARGKNCEMQLKLRLLKDMANFQTLQTWIGHNLTYYHNLNVLPHKLPRALFYNFSNICVVLRYLKRVTTRYCHFF